MKSTILVIALLIAASHGFQTSRNGIVCSFSAIQECTKTSRLGVIMQAQKRRLKEEKRERNRINNWKHMKKRPTGRFKVARESVMKRRADNLSRDRELALQLFKFRHIPIDDPIMKTRIDFRPFYRDIRERALREPVPYSESHGEELEFDVSDELNENSQLEDAEMAQYEYDYEYYDESEESGRFNEDGETDELVESGEAESAESGTSDSNNDEFITTQKDRNNKLKQQPGFKDRKKRRVKRKLLDSDQVAQARERRIPWMFRAEYEFVPGEEDGEEDEVPIVEGFNSPKKKRRKRY